MVPPGKQLYEFEPFVLDAGSRILLKDGATVRLTPKAFDTLLVLVQHAQEVIDKDQLLKQVWPDTYVEEASLARNIHELRKSLGDDSAEPRYIETIPKRGYRFAAPVKISVAARPAPHSLAEAETTVIEKHTYARVITDESEETESQVDRVINVGATRPALVAARQTKRTWWIAAVIVIVFAIGIGALIYLRRTRVPPPVLSRAKSTLVRLTNNSAMEGAPVWSPDGSKIVFWSNRDGKKEIYVMDSDGSNVTRLTNNLADEFNPKWSPDGTKDTF